MEDSLSPFILCIALNSAEAHLINKLAAEVFDNHLLGANLLGFGSNCVEVLILADVGEKGDDIVTFVE